MPFASNDVGPDSSIEAQLPDLVDQLGLPAEVATRCAMHAKDLRAYVYANLVWLKQTRRYDLDIARELRAALPQGRVVTLGCRDDTTEETWSFPTLADLPDEVAAPVLLLGAQHVALAQSLALGLEPDNPFPGGQVNRVVEGVTIHDLDA